MSAAQILGIVAGGGELATAIARAVREDGRPVFLLGLDGIADPGQLRDFPHAWACIGEIAKMVALLKDAGCSEITFAGRVSRPDFSKLRLDRLAAQYLPRLLAAALKGDDGLLRAVISIFEHQQFRVVGAADVTRQLLARGGPFGDISPDSLHMEDMRQGARVVSAMGEFDIGQAAVTCEGLVLAVEAAEGTDAMLSRVAGLPQPLRGTSSARRGVLVKALKPRQERRVDMPVIGPRTVELASAAGLAGIGVQADGVLVLNRKQVVETADLHGLFVYGFGPSDLVAAASG